MLWGKLKRFWGPIAAIAAFGAVLSGLLGYWHAYQTVVAPTLPSVAVPTPTPRAFSIAILPFASPGATAADELIARELAPDLTNAFGRANRYVWVVSPRLAESYGNKPIDPRAVGRELNVRYLVEGKLRRTGDRLLLTATLTDAATATQIWSENVQVADAETEGTSMALSQMNSGLRSALYTAEARRVAAQGPAAASAMDLMIRGWNIEDTNNPTGLSLPISARRKSFMTRRFSSTRIRLRSSLHVRT
jgi:TolB-like protein